MDLATELQSIYDSEINVEISWLWDDGIEVRLGDRMNGYLAETTVRSVADIHRRYVDVNRAATEALGVEREAIIGQRIDDFFAIAPDIAVPTAWGAFV
jgi:PAS domain-containing protein